MEQDLKPGDRVIYDGPDDLAATGRLHEILGGNRGSVTWDIESDPMPSILPLAHIKRTNF